MRQYTLLIISALLLVTGTLTTEARPAAVAHAEGHSSSHGQSAMVTSDPAVVPAARPDAGAGNDKAVGSRSPILPLTVYCLLIVGASLFGGWLPSRIRLAHTRMQTIISFVGGLMLGIGVFHLLPHATHQLNFGGRLHMDAVSLCMMSGIIVMFLLMRLFHFHDHGVAESSEGSCDPCEQDHEHSHGHAHSYAHSHVHELSWLGIVTGLSIHTLIDGIALGSAVSSESLSGATLFPSLGVFLAILLHKPLDSMSITALMAAGGWKESGRQMVNAGFALMCPLGTGLFFLGVSRFPSLQRELAGGAMAFSAGIFLCIALSDLLPEMEFHSHDRARLSVALALGVVAAWVMRFLEPSHLH